MKTFQKYATIEKKVGETPLVATERLREFLKISVDVPTAYAGRLDPMASGKLLILIGDECKRQKHYHNFDKRYIVEVLIGATSDTGDVLGIIEIAPQVRLKSSHVREVLDNLRGTITLPYPHFSSRTVRGKPLHIWALEGRLTEIEIPTKTSHIYSLTMLGTRTISKEEVLTTVRAKIETIPKVTDERKVLGHDFRRSDVRASWHTFEKNAKEKLEIITLSCTASSGTYMRSLAEEIGKKLGSGALAYSIHRTHIGRYQKIFKNKGFWWRTF